MSNPTLAICIAALESRNYQALLDELRFQSEQLENGPDKIELHILPDNGEMPSGKKRQYLSHCHNCDYMCFIDDDDMVHPKYLEYIYPELRKSPDVVTFNLRFRNMTRRSNPEIWKFGLHAQNRKRGLMTANHLCVWKTEIARMSAWCPYLGYADDQVWYQPLYYLHHHGLERFKEIHIPYNLYFYDWSAEVSSNTNQARIRASKVYVGEGLKCFYNPGEGCIYIETGGGSPRQYLVRTPEQEENWVDKSDLDPYYYHTIQIN